MASTSSTQPPTAPKMILTPVMTLKGHNDQIRSISYFRDGRQMISGALDNTTRRWDLQAGKEIEGVRDLCKWGVGEVAVSRNGRWVITASRDVNRPGELKGHEVETRRVKRFKGHAQTINCIDISEDSMLLASGSNDGIVRIWSMDTGKLVAGPFKSAGMVGAVRFSQDSQKLAVKSDFGSCLEVWDVRTQKLHRRVGKFRGGHGTYAPVFWTNKETILAAFAFDEVVDDDRGVVAMTIYEFDSSTLETIGAPFEGHTDVIYGLALSFDGALVASTSDDNTIKLWAFESRQLLASFYVLNPYTLTLSPGSRQLAYTTGDENKIFICNTPPEVLASIGLAPENNVTTPGNSTLRDPLNFDAPRRRANVRRNPAASPVLSFPPRLQRPLPTRELQQRVFLRRLRKLLPTSPHPSAVSLTQDGQPRDLLNKTVPHSQPQLEYAGLPRVFFDGSETTYPPRRAANAGSQQARPEETRLRRFIQQHLSLRRSPPSNDLQVVEVAAGRKFIRLAAADLPEYKKVDDTRRLLPQAQQQPGVSQDMARNDQSYESSDNDSLPDVHWCNAFLCYCSCWSHGKLRMPPRWILERVDEHGQNGTTSSGSRVLHL
ncbi:WD40 repeat-like protein [Rhizopogon salebrosus TDB-379]|nr:WD40 repeat-like protein [Rhizopogon salebrosus TDB-379]